MLIQLDNVLLKVICILLLGLTFLLPGAELLLFLVTIIYFSKNSFTEPFLKIKRLIKGCKVFLLLLPMVVIVGSVSHYLLYDYSKQDIVIKLKEASYLESIPMIFSVLFVAPFIEEFYFRKLLMDSLLKWLGILFAVIFSALYFSLIHLNIFSFPILFTLGISLGVVRLISNDWLASVLCHLFFNSFMLVQIYS
jgi:membrane protease YdiL (CAAX protease family)